MQSTSILPKPSGAAGNMKPGQSQGGKASFVICEICDGWIKDLDQLRNHMQWMHKVKVKTKHKSLVLFQLIEQLTNFFFSSQKKWHCRFTRK